MGRFHRKLEPGLNILMPFIDRVRYVKSLKEIAVEIPSQSAITQGLLFELSHFYVSFDLLVLYILL